MQNSNSKLLIKKIDEYLLLLLFFAYYDDQVINHGISENLMDDTMNIYKEFFKLPSEYKAKFYSNDINKSCRLCSSTLAYDTEEFHYWRDNFTHHCYPLEEYIMTWPNKPTKYR